MPTWAQINEQIDTLAGKNSCDIVRNEYLKKLASHVGRPVIAYYSGFLQKRLPDGRFHPECTISDNDMNGLMATIHRLPRDKGLDLLLHTPGGDLEAARGFVEYLYKMFGKNVRVIVPQIAMSAGTMIACAATTVVMGKHSCLGPTDPQISGMPAMGVLAEVDRAIGEIQRQPLKQIIWTQVFSKYPPGFIGNCERAVEGVKILVKKWLCECMLKDENDPEASADTTIANLMNYMGTSTNSHHFLVDKCKEFGLKVTELESDQTLQDYVLSVHHCFMATFSRMSTIKIIENSEGLVWAVNN